MSTPSDPDQPRYGQEPAGDRPPEPPRYGDAAPGYGQSSGDGSGYDRPSSGGYGEPARYGGDASASPYGGEPHQEPRNGLGVAALVVGIVALLSVCVGIFLAGIPAVVIGVVGIVLGVGARRRVKRGEATNGGVATTGLVLSIVSLVLGILSIVLFAVGLSFFGDIAEQCQGLTGAEQEQCVQDQTESLFG
ncbi:DUF4190 domain-containing protein [uncultured Pseudokineococcus sp.]|uniref:DUF4190 domain-containing protein n=1 Tax=uncultured Pseudokineococcus sp. TaxID=1642928 RepID=UPI00260E9A2C|nr:DUF4190 domain-containing protein [uncultured Pseudokineococcus sp.]